MTSIAPASSQPAYQSPLDRLQNELQSEVSAGTISSNDQDALSSALDDIDQALQSQRQSDQASGVRPARGEMKSKIDDLIAQEVQNGKLTSDQADELKNVFAKTFEHHGHGGPGGAGGPGGPGGAGGGPDCGPGGASDASAASDTSSTDSTSQLLQDFLKMLQQSSSQDSTYGANGDSSSSSLSVTALVVNYQA